MEPNPSPDAAARSSPGSAVAVRGRGVAATWLVTAAVVLFFEIVILALWVPVVAPATAGTSWREVACLAAGSVWVASSAWLLWIYRGGTGEGGRGPTAALLARRTVPVVASGAASVLVVVASGMVLVGGAVAAQTIVLLRESVGSRRRLCLAVTAALAVLWVVDVSLGLRPASPPTGTNAASVYAVLLPSTSAFALWWWDIVEQLDHARAAEGRLAAAQERLRLAHDVHDLQGHHLQVIALQLELAERLLARDPTAALEQVRAARSSVDDARQGTRDLATRFRGVPLADELANAADLLRAAGIRVELSVAHQAAQAPTDVLGPVIRETTTNMLKHSGGGWATLTLRRSADDWTYTAGNDVAGRGACQVRTGNGLRGIDERVRAVGGHVTISSDASRFEVSATVPGTGSRTHDDDRGGDR